MGAGGRMYVSSEDEIINKRVPSTKPPFSLSDIKKAIPPHCFQRSLIRAASYLVRDLLVAFLLYYVANTYIPLLPNSLSYIAWPLYWFCQGTVMMGIWIIGHECGHQGFSEYQWVNDTVGFILHSALFTPYFSWKYSHRSHHLHTNSLEDEVCYIPESKSKSKTYAKIVSNPIGRFVVFTILLTVGYPLHLGINLYGKKYGRFASHFVPTSPIYTERERANVFFSDVGILIVLYGLYHFAAAKGATWLICIYGVPLLVQGMWFILVTYLQHTHLSVPFYDSTEWDWMRGALSTIDRDFGCLNGLFSNAPYTHVVHHLFSTIPHYHAIEAKEAIKPILGDYYKFDSTPVLKALWAILKECVYVEPDEGKKGIHWFHNKM